MEKSIRKQFGELFPDFSPRAMLEVRYKSIRKQFGELFSDFSPRAMLEVRKR